MLDGEIKFFLFLIEVDLIGLMEKYGIGKWNKSFFYN